MNKGSLTHKDYAKLLNNNKIINNHYKKSQIQPSSLDLTLSEEAYEVKASFLSPNGKIRDKLKTIFIKKIDLKNSKIFKNIENNSHMYFVHSYEFVPEDKNVISATTDYSSNIVCSVEKENIFGTQFHPEKSDKIGLKIIDNFINLL